MKYSQWDSLMLNDVEMRHETEITKMTIHFLQCAALMKIPMHWLAKFE